MVIQHISGKKHQNADALSRIPDVLPSCDNYRTDVPLRSMWRMSLLYKSKTAIIKV